jgi:hypothetical protein
MQKANAWRRRRLRRRGRRRQYHHRQLYRRPALLLHHPAHHIQHQHLHHRASELIENIQDFHRRRAQD